MPKVMKYSEQELELLLGVVKSGAPLFGIEARLNVLNRPGQAMRTELGVAEKLAALVKRHPETWDGPNVEDYLLSVKRLRWSSISNPYRVQDAYEKVVAYLRNENPNATAVELTAAGLSYEVSLAFGQNMVNAAKRAAGLEERAFGQQAHTADFDRQRVRDYLENHPEATSGELTEAGLGNALKVYLGGIDDARRDAGILPQGYISAADAARELRLKCGVSDLVARRKLEALRVGNRVYVSVESVERRKKRLRTEN